MKKISLKSTRRIFWKCFETGKFHLRFGIRIFGFFPSKYSFYGFYLIIRIIWNIEQLSLNDAWELNENCVKINVLYHKFHIKISQKFSEARLVSGPISAATLMDALLVKIFWTMSQRMVEKFLTLLALVSHFHQFGQNWPKNMAILAIMAKMKLLSRVQTTVSKIGRKKNRNWLNWT